MTSLLAGQTAAYRAGTRARSLQELAANSNRPRGAGYLGNVIRRLMLIAVFMSAWFVTSATPVAAAGCINFSAARFNTLGADTPRTNTRLNGEWVRIKSTCSTRQAIGGWKIHDYGRRHTYTFAAGTRIAAGGSITLYTGKGTNTSTRKYWGKGNYVWNNSCPEKAYLRSVSGSLRSAYNPLRC